MSEPSSDALLSDDEFLAACHEIEALAQDSESAANSKRQTKDSAAEAIPDAHSSGRSANKHAANDSAPPGGVAVDEGSPASGESEAEPKSAAPDEATASDTPSGSDQSGGNATAASEPARAAGSSTANTEDSQSESDSGKCASDVGATQRVASLPQGTGKVRKKGLRFRVGAGAAAAAAETARPTEARDETTHIAVTPRTALWKRIYRAVDDALERLNRPIQRMIPRPVRDLIGRIALVTIVVSLLAAWLLPWLLPSQDAISFVRERRSALEAARVESVQETKGNPSAETLEP